MINQNPYVFVGWDSKTIEDYKVCEFSIKKHCPEAIVYPIKQQELRDKGIYWREKDQATTEFSITRFLTPYLMDYADWAVFCDADFLWNCNIERLFEFADPRYAVRVVKHFHDPYESLKKDNQKQTKYECKNWSSLILWNCGHEKNKNLTKGLVNTVSPAFLHRFWWLKPEDIGDLPLTFNFLSMYYHKWPKGELPNAIHFTSGSPLVKGHENDDYSDIWMNTYRELQERLDY